MIAVDTNILVYAHRSTTNAHARAVEWLRYLAEGDRPWAIPLFCFAEFLRVVTHPKIFSPPSTLQEAIAALREILRSPSLVVLTPASRFLSALFDVTEEGDARGNIVFDAQIAALCLENGVRRLLTTDRDFGRFSSLRIVSLADPFS